MENIEEALKKHKKALVAYSGGKESVVLKHFLQDYDEHLEYVWVNTGAMLPHMRDFILAQGVTELHSNQESMFRSHGLPSKIVPTFNTELVIYDGTDTNDRLMLTHAPYCCGALRAMPIANYAKTKEIGLVFHGQLLADGGKHHQGLLGISNVCPLWEWSELDVYKYIDDNKLKLPKQYQLGYKDSIECWNCPSELNADRFEYIANYHPEKWQVLKPMIISVYAETMSALDRHKLAFEKAIYL